MYPPRIILTSNYSPWSRYSGGGQRSTHNIAVHLAKLGIDVHVVYTKPFLEKILVPSNLPYQIHWANYPGLRTSRKNTLRFLSARSVKQVVKSILVEGCIVHSNGEEGAFVGDLKKDLDFKHVITPRYPYIPSRINEFKPTFSAALFNPSKAKYILLHKSLNEADAVFPTSIFSLKMLKSIFKLNKTATEVIPNGVSEIFMHDTLPDVNSNRIIFFGRLSNSKGIDTLIASLKVITDHIDELVIIGRGEYESLIRQENMEGPLAGKINLINWLEPKDLVQEIRKSKIAVLPSREESFGNSIAEAMACAVPVVSTTAGSIPEIVDNDNVGILVNPDSVDELTDAILKLLADSNKMKTIAKNGNQRVKNEFSWERTVERYLNAYSIIQV